MTYIDHADKDDFSPHDLMRDWVERPSLQPQSVTIAASYRLSDKIEAGVTLQPALRVSDNRPVYQLTIEVAKPHASGETLVQSFNALHEQATDLFQTLTSDSAQQRWGREVK
jgi:hypothetical protein